MPKALLLDIPAGWTGCGLLFKEVQGGLMMVGFWKVGFVYPDPCHWEETLAAHPATGTAAQVVQDFMDQQRTAASVSQEDPVGGSTATHLALSVPNDADLTDCDKGQGAEFRFMQGDGDSVWWLAASDANSLMADIWVLGGNDGTYVIQTAHYPDNSAVDVAEQTQMVRSISFVAED